MYMWSEEERLVKFMKSVKKWLEFQESDIVDIDEKRVERAFEKGKGHSYEIIQKFEITDQRTAGFLQSWVELGLFAGYLTGWKNSDQLLLESINRSSEDFYITQQISEAAHKYASDVTNTTFDRLVMNKSPLIAGLRTETVNLLVACHESALYAGFLSGLEDAFNEKLEKFTPRDIQQIMT